MSRPVEFYVETTWSYPGAGERRWAPRIFAGNGHTVMEGEWREGVPDNRLDEIYAQQALVTEFADKLKGLLTS